MHKGKYSMMDISKISFTPLDIPMLPFKEKDKLIDIFYKEMELISKPSDPSLPTFWKGFTCYKSKEFNDDNLLHKGKFIDLSSLLAEEISILETNLPITLESISLWANHRDVIPHFDAKIYETDLDFRFRFIIIQEKESFFIKVGNDLKFITMPSVTNSFCFNNQLFKHGGTYNESNKKILGIVRGKIIDVDNLKILLDRSANLYKEHAIIAS
jgi:hypothetical protein